MSSNKEKSPIWGIIMTVVFGLLAIVALYNLYYILRIWFTDGYLLLSYQPRDFQFWTMVHHFPLTENKFEAIYQKYASVMNFHNFLFGLSMLCLVAFCVLAILRKDRKDKFVILTLTAFAILQFVYYGLEFCQIVDLFGKRDIPLKEWKRALVYYGYAPYYLWECVWKVVTCIILLLYALKNFVPVIENLLNGNLKKILFIVFTIIFWLSFVFFPFNGVRWFEYATHYEDILCVLPFLTVTLGLVCQSAVFTWFIKD